MHRPAPKITFVFITLLLDVLGFGLLIPVGPRLIAHVEGLLLEGSEDKVSWAVGFLAATYAVMQFIFAPILGSLSDRFGRRPVILIALFGSGLDYLVMAMAPSLWVLFVTRAINGISGANMTACNAYIADITPPEKRSAAFGMIGAAFGMGFVFGPLLGGLLGAYDVRAPFVAAGVLTLANWLYGYFVIPESLPEDRRRPFSWSKANPLGAFKWLSGHVVVIHLAVAIFLINLAQFGLHVTWVLSMTRRFHWGPAAVGWSLFVVGITSAIVQGGLARKIIPALGERACLLGGMTIGMLAFLGYGLAPSGWMIYVIIALASIGGVSGPALQGIMSKAVPPTEQGLLQGALASLQSVAAIGGPLLATQVFRAFTNDHAPVQIPGAPFIAGTILMALSLIPILMVWSRMPHTVREKPDEDAAPEQPDAAASSAETA